MGETSLRERLIWVYETLLRAYGPQGWWPGETPFEVMVGAVLTQHTAWRNAAQALESLRQAGVLSPAGLRGLSEEALAELLRAAGTFRVKARRLKAFVAYLWRAHGGDPAGLAQGDWHRLRSELLRVRGIGPETADSILLYGGGHPTFVVDAYASRLLARLDLVSADASYEQVRLVFLDHLPPDAALFNEYHALIVRHGKEHCRSRAPRCAPCPLLEKCVWPKGEI